ncbi:MAG: Gfo/Idh/MocA family oxidoreductase [Alphaproteobacteria bacterium]|nr:Gfo/Idh/MocA family oxidoreductase [Alphaproteobacteria bacterium]
MATVAPLGNKPLRVALVGAGFVAPIHLRGWAMVDGVEVCAMSSRTKSRAEKTATAFGVGKVYESVDAMLEAERPDVLDICSPVETHLDYVRQAAARGTHVICQKPVADRMETALAIRDTAATAGIRLMVHENFRFRVWYREAKRQLDSGIIGTPFYCRSDARMAGTVRTAANPETPWSIQRQPFFADLERFLLLESVIHQIDVCRFLFGDPTRIFARTQTVGDAVKGENLVTLLADFDDLHAVIERSYASKGYVEPPLVTELLAVEGDRGSLFIDRDGAMRVEIDRPGARETIRPTYDLTDAYPNSYAAAIRHFVDRMRDGAPFETDIEDNLKTLAATLAAYESAASGDSVPLTLSHPKQGDAYEDTGHAG